MNRLKKGLQGIINTFLYDCPFRCDRNKINLIDTAFKNFVPNAKSFADLGGVWGVDGAYTFYLLEKYHIERSFLVDTDFTQPTKKKGHGFGSLTMINSNFGCAAVAKKIGYVDAILLFDVLLHQVRPDWDQLLEMYSENTNCFVVYNPQYIVSDTSVRLPDLGKEKYFNHVLMDRNSVIYKNLFETPDEINLRHNRPWRDIHNVWQWGITDKDLIRVMKQLKFDLVYYRNYMKFCNFESFENHAFVFLNTR